jgi:flagellar protein FlaF
MSLPGDERAQAAISAYRKTTTTTTSPRQQEHEIIARVNHRLRGVMKKHDAVELARAISDNQVLWTVLMADLQNPNNQLPPQLKGMIISVGMAVMREMDQMGKRAVDLDFLVSVNQNLMEGLEGKS